jgi:tetratricopeptide (TPR) repeat protein/pSer/pThr/pTyr-binding forkhead associated (FHA) protein
MDLNSRNGTYVNGMRILEHPLTSFDTIQLGDNKIKFLIQDMLTVQSEGTNQLATNLVTSGSQEVVLDSTKSVHVGNFNPEALGISLTPPMRDPSPFPEPTEMSSETEEKSESSPLPRLILGTLLGLLLVYFLLPSTPDADKVAQEAGKEEKPIIDKSSLPASLPKEFLELTDQIQRAVEGHYNSAVKAGDSQSYEEALSHLKTIHEYLPFYKKSRELADKFGKKLKEKQIAEAQEKAKTDEKQDLTIYLQEGIEYLKEGDFDRAAESFNSAIVIDPNNPVAVKGLRAAELKIRDMEQIPPDKDPEEDKRKQVAELFQKAVAAFSSKSYNEAITTAEKIRTIELKGDTEYLNEAKQIIDRAKMLQKEQFEPFLIQAKEKYAEGDYKASRDLCEEMLKRDQTYDEAEECVLKAKKQLHRLAKEAYTHGYILESMNRLEEAKQYWNRAKNFTRSGDEYFDKVNKKLDYYQ